MYIKRSPLKRSSRRFCIAMSQVLFIIALFFTIALAQYPIQNGTCLDFSTCHDAVNYADDKVLGIWYVTANVPYFWSVGKKCTYLKYTVLPESNSLHSELTEYDNM